MFRTYIFKIKKYKKKTYKKDYNIFYFYFFFFFSCLILSIMKIIDSKDYFEFRAYENSI